MGLRDIYLLLASTALGAIIAVLYFTGPARLFVGSRSRVPKRFEVKDIPSGDIPSDAQKPLDQLTTKLRAMGFEVADLPVRVPLLQGFGYRLLLVPFVHPDESTFFLMGIEAGIHPRTQLMLHILTPLSEGRRVETTTLAPLDDLRHPAGVDCQVVLDANSVEEIWSRHRRALFRYERKDRRPVQAEAWRLFAAEAYEAWVQAAVRSHRLQLEANGVMYRVRRHAR
ncbi:MAG: hypothetical protein IPG45_32410 [Deltaproteobacteria bacterium]|jgi:hypothetical protein|nr:hypothetical protein [Deltaproteobacteria bacterium]